MVEGRQAEALLLVVLAPPLLAPFALELPLLPPLEVLPPPLLPPSESAEQMRFTQLPLQQSVSELQLVPRPALALSGTQLVQSDERSQPVGQTTLPQFPLVVPLLLQEAERAPATTDKRRARAARGIVSTSD